MARSGLYVQLDVNFPDDDKIEEVGLDGAGLYAASLCVAKRLLTDGRLTRRKLHAIGADDALIDRCIAAGLYREDDEGVWIAAWLGHNPSADTVADKRAKDAARKRRNRAEKRRQERQTSTLTSNDSPDGHGRDGPVTGDGRSADGVTQTETETETEIPLPSQTQFTTGHPQADDEEAQPPDRDIVDDVIDHLTDHRLDQLEADGRIRTSRRALRPSVRASTATDHHQAIHATIRAHPDRTIAWIVDQILHDARPVERQSVPLEESRHPAVVAQQRATREPDGPPASAEAVRRAKAEALNGLASTRTLAAVPDPEEPTP